MAADSPTAPPESEASELKAIVSRYPKLFFRIIVASLLLIGSGGSAWLHSAYAQFKATTEAIDHITEEQDTAAKERKVILETLAERNGTIDRRFNEQRQDIQEIRKDIKELLSRSRTAAPQRNEAR